MVILSMLSRDQLAEDALANAAEAKMHGLNQDKGFLLFDGRTWRPHFFHRHRGIDLSNGEIHIGGVQFESSVVQRFAGAWLDGVSQPEIDFWDGKFNYVPTLFEIERLFVGDLGRFELTHMFADGRSMGESTVQENRATFEQWHQEYQEAVAGSLMGRPLLEADYAYRMHDMQLDPRKLYGERVHAQLRKLSRRDLRKKYPQT